MVWGLIGTTKTSEDLPRRAKDAPQLGTMKPTQFHNTILLPFHTLEEGIARLHMSTLESTCHGN